MAASGMHNLTTLIKRLEAATSRLEDIASSSGAPEADPEAARSPPQTGIAKVAGAGAGAGLASGSISNASLPTGVEVPEAVTEFDKEVLGAFATVSSLSHELGAPLDEQDANLEKALRINRRIIFFAAKSKKIDMQGSLSQSLIGDINAVQEEMHSLTTENMKSPLRLHLEALEKALGLVFWPWDPLGTGKPERYIAEGVIGDVSTTTNKILRDQQDKDNVHCKWAKALIQLCKTMASYLKANHATGLAFNLTPSAMDPEAALSQAKAAAPAVNGTDTTGTDTPVAGGGAPPPPPPPLPPAFDITENRSASSLGAAGSGGDMSGVFSEINKGESVTAGLKKVDKSQMTHKNPSLRASSNNTGAAAAVPVRSDSSSSRGKSPAPNKKPESMRAKKPPKKELEGNKWTIEHYDGQQEPIEIDAERQHSILVSRCKHTNVIVHGKANAVAIDNCTRVNVIVDSLVSTVEVVNCASFALQINGSIPAVQLDKVDSATIYLSKDSMSTELYTSKCTGVNVTLPPADDDDDSTECPVPEQFKSRVVDGKLVSEIVYAEG